MRHLEHRIKELILKNGTLTYYAKLIKFHSYNQQLQSVSDRDYILKQYKQKTGRELNIENPKLFNEKLQWLKLNYRNDDMKICVDKYLVRDYVEKRLGKNHLVKLYGVYNDANEINFDVLPDKFILKLTNGSGFNIICKNKKEINENKIRKQLNRWLKITPFSYAREWAYKDVPNRIICEELLLDNNGNIPEDYKIHCFNGEPKLIQVDTGRFTSHKRNIYDTNWNLLPVKVAHENETKEIIKPNKIDLMLDFSRVLSKDFPFARIDFYFINNKVYFGEITFYPAAGYEVVEPIDMEYKMGDWLNISYY